MIAISIFSFLLITNFSLHGMKNEIQCSTIILVDTLQHTSQEPKDKQKKQQNDILNFLKQCAINAQRDNEICVAMCHFGSITSTPTLRFPKIISINGLGACLATALYIRCDNREQYVGITNYPRLSYKEQQDKLNYLCSEILKAQHETKKIIKVDFFFIAPFSINQSYTKEYKELESIIQTTLNQTVTSYPCTYKMGHQPKNRWRDLEITLHNIGAQVVIKGYPLLKFFNLS